MLPKINLEHLELLRPCIGGLRSSSMEAPGLHETNFNTQCYNDAIGLTSRSGRSVLDKLFFQNEV